MKAGREIEFIFRSVGSESFVSGGSDVTVVDFAELMLSSHVFPSAKADNLFRRVREQGQITKENVVLTEAQKRHLSLRRAA